MEPALRGANVGGNALAFEKEFNGGGGEFRVDSFIDEAAGDAVIMEIDFDVVVDVDLRLLPFGEFVGVVGKRSGGGAVEIVEKLAAGLLDFAEGTAIEGFKKMPDRGVHFGKRMKDAVAQDSEDPSFCDEDTVFDLGLVAGAARTGGKDSGAIMVGHVLVGGVEGGFIEAGFEDAAFEVVGNQEVGDGSEIREGAGVGADPVGEGLGQRGLDVGKGGGAPDGDEELGEGHFAGEGVSDKESVGVIDEEFVTALVGLPHDKVAAGAPVVVSSTEGRVEIAVGMLSFVFDPELVESQVKPFVVLQLLMGDFPLGERLGGLRRGDGEQEVFQGFVGEGGREGPGNAGLFGST